MPTTTWNRHHVLSLADFKPAEYDTVLQTAASFQEVLSRRTKKVPTLQGQVVANLFFEPSTRTRSSFELAAKRLSADTLNFAAATSSMTKGETILDTAKTYLAMGTDIMVVRHKEAGVPNAIAAEMDRLGVKVSVLNAGDGQHEHPSQALLDLFTICSLIDPNHPRLELLQGKKIAIVGDILHSRVARSNIWSFIASGAQVHLAAPPTLLPKLFAEYILEEDAGTWRRGDAGTRGRGDTGNEEDTQTQAYNNVVNKNENFSVSPRHPLSASSSQLFLHWQLEPALQDADFVMTLRLQKERMTAHLLPSLREYHQLFGITSTKLQLCKPHVKVLHPGPVNRGVEISSELMDDPEFSLIQSQVTSGVAVRMALLYLLGSGKA
ncbi:MAG: aspartate carbamoyltransferase catalytic subunit [Nostoc sp. ZfuVER08]|jgi:aspartate carbamoyltransferase catalytic subunit|uniref:Aspartate carbamoyltransferase n=1 Tax=Nostoc punctiforme FACHB-252 TaxID=1357509 RepID=A0ABR8H690_NOSPU|nr:aspartate carbamoyltransferase catalytic subunit [Nostoc punctiforme]MBD2610913.1 aspartate carbamoyltransferase [Nostoc punctiforme FACHB-252]MBL1200795.1 aspartate carbamoyltransferase [Nostoc sp. GBBB01]MDZ8014541.1 aspartate carbamoyltransferase catalytic subunit [Nostoc sp. ZfuVER08]